MAAQGKKEKIFFMKIHSDPNKENGTNNFIHVNIFVTIDNDTKNTINGEIKGSKNNKKINLNSLKNKNLNI